MGSFFLLKVAGILQQFINKLENPPVVFKIGQNLGRKGSRTETRLALVCPRGGSVRKGKGGATQCRAATALAG